jgi:hypothetical protein
MSRNENKITRKNASLLIAAVRDAVALGASNDSIAGLMERWGIDRPKVCKHTVLASREHCTWCTRPAETDDVVRDGIITKSVKVL